MTIYSSFNEDSGNVTFSRDAMGILNVDLNNINIDDVNFDKDDPKTIIHVKPLAWRNKFGKRISFKKEVNRKN